MIFARKIIKIPNFMIFARKIYKIPEFYMIFARKMSEFYIIIARKIFLPNFRGNGPPPLPPSPTPCQQVPSAHWGDHGPELNWYYRLTPKVSKRIRSVKQQAYLQERTRVTADMGKTAFAHIAVNVWNNLPVEITSPTTYQTLNATLKPTCSVHHTVLNPISTHLATAGACLKFS